MTAPTRRTDPRDDARLAADEMNRPELKLAEKPTVEKVGLGYKATFTGGVVMTVSRLRESRSELSGELTIIHEGLKRTTAGGHVFRGRFNLDSPTTRKTLASMLTTRAKADWLYYLELFCSAVLDRERTGAPVIRIGQMPPKVFVPPIVGPILPGEGVTVLFGAGGVGKSTVAAAVAVMAFTGEPIVPTWTVTNACRPLILDYEDTAEAWNNLIAQLARGAGIALPDIHYLAMHRPIADEVERIAGIVTTENIGFVIVDSAGLAMGVGSEHSDAADGALKLFIALRELGVPALVIDHVAASEMRSNGAASKPYGSVYKWNSARTVWELKREKESTDDYAEVLLVNGKHNHGAKRTPIGLNFVYGEGTIAIQPGDVNAADLQGGLRTVDRMRKLLAQGAMADESVADGLDVSESTVRSMLKRHPSFFSRPAKGLIGLFQTLVPETDDDRV